MVAIDADCRQVAYPFQPRHPLANRVRGDAQDRVAVFFRRDGDDHVSRALKGKLGLGAELPSVEAKWFDTGTAKQGELFCRPGRSVKGSALAVRRREGPARISRSEYENLSRHAGIP